MQDHGKLHHLSLFLFDLLRLYPDLCKSKFPKRELLLAHSRCLYLSNDYSRAFFIFFTLTNTVDLLLEHLPWVLIHCQMPSDDRLILEEAGSTKAEFLDK